MPGRGSFICGSLFLSLFVLISCAAVASAGDPLDPETAIRQMVRANAEKDLPTLSRLMAHDADIVSYTVGGRKYVGWPEFEREMREEFVNTQKIEIPITELKVWTKGDLAWFTMERRLYPLCRRGIRREADGPALERNRRPRTSCRPLAIVVVARIVPIGSAWGASCVAVSGSRLTKARQHDDCRLA